MVINITTYRLCILSGVNYMSPLMSSSTICSHYSILIKCIIYMFLPPKVTMCCSLFVLIICSSWSTDDAILEAVLPVSPDRKYHRLIMLISCAHYLYSRSPVDSILKAVLPVSPDRKYHLLIMLISCAHYLYSRSPVDSILEAVLTVSPNKQYRGIFNPTTPVTQEPEE